MMRSLAFLLLVFATEANAALVAYDRAGDQIIVATANEITIHALDGKILRRAPGVESPSEIVVDEPTGTAFVIDAVNETAVRLEAGRATATELRLGEMPADATAVRGKLFFVGRSSGTVQQAGADSGPIDIGFPPTLLRRSGETVVAYNSVDGQIAVIDGASASIVKRGKVAPDASDAAVEAEFVYFTHPRRGIVSVVALATLQTVESLRVGAVPVDVELAGNRNAISAGEIVVADPASKRVWREERQQSVASATARGFARGLVGLGLYKPKSGEFPTGIDRVFVAGRHTFAYDSSSRTLYRLAGKKAVRVATSLGAREFALTPAGEAVVYDERAGRIRSLGR